MREARTLPTEPADRARYGHYLTTARAQLGEAAWAAAWTEGRALSPEEAVAYALAGDSGSKPPAAR